MQALKALHVTLFDAYQSEKKSIVLECMPKMKERMMVKVLSVHVGRAKTYGDANAKDFLEREWRTASFKEVVKRPLHVGFEGFEDDEVADRAHHGGIDKAVFANSYENYAHWAAFLGLERLPFGALSENLTIVGMHESNVMLGDIHEIGSAILQVTQPRKPCWKISRRWNHTELTNKIFTDGLSGWYYRVLKEGIIGTGDTVRTVSHEICRISILEANHAFKEPEHSTKTLERILTLPSIAQSYRDSIVRRLEGTSDLAYMQTL